jgi:hypothetical protein
VDHPDSSLPKRRKPDQIREELERLRTEHPNEYATNAARLLKELEDAERSRTRFAKT